MKIHLILISVIVVSFSAGPAQAGFLEFFFPTLKDEGYDPSETLTAPFADQGQVSSEAAEGNVKTPANVVPLHVPHRATSVIAEWLIVAASEVLTFDGENVQEDLEATKKNFDAGGRVQYELFLEEKKLMNVLKSNKYKIRAYVRDAPLLLNEGPVSDRYRWLYEVPVTVSYMKRGVNDYKSADPINQNIVLTLQVGRSAEAKDGVLIERWAGKVQQLEK